LTYKRFQQKGRINFKCPAQKAIAEEAIQRKRSTERRFSQTAMQNPLDKYVGQIPAQKILFPAISADYDLLDCSTWCKILSEDPKDPFTRKPLMRRQLQFVTSENGSEVAPNGANLGRADHQLIRKSMLLKWHEIHGNREI
jgi:hypothetical protein